MRVRVPHLPQRTAVAQVSRRRIALCGFACALWLGLAASARAAALPLQVAAELKAASIPPTAVAVVTQAVDGRWPQRAVNARQAMNPASVMKLVTTFAALDRLGPAFTWQTEAYLGGELNAGILHGDLILRGGGDPKLTWEQFARLLQQLRARGLREIRGDLVLDRGAFAVPPNDPGAFDAEPLRPYNVAPDALLLNFNALSLTLLPEPPVAGLDLVNRIELDPGAECGDWREGPRADVFAHPAAIRLVLSGRYPARCEEQRWHIALADHTGFVAGVFRALWTQLGGALQGAVRDGPTPPAAHLFAVLPAPTLGEAVHDINKYSNNVMARQLFLTLGLAAGHRPAGTADGVAAIGQWLQSRGLDFPELVLENGAGLSRRERISAASLARLLQAAWRSAVMPELMASLPVVAVDGTMKKRLHENGVAGQAHIKTGSLDGVKSLAGFVLDRNGRRWIVVFLVNHPRAARAGPAMDALLKWVWQHGG
ncbi:MAG: D-alanyl-D-alanine carboxypeptidase/D-alanyl-D-alanine-endopeptidase [Betaproteobacteria bacterium HGW-Betaproteobacteria-11]|nr:MAG: D-alanyl-D-alanine carboxypeptidase/D-alanyl-D-alanine-endopeptidase [Betaproteobacteria bacterium HGW-Betaproteobacteria-11]